MGILDFFEYRKELAKVKDEMLNLAVKQHFKKIEDIHVEAEKTNGTSQKKADAKKLLRKDIRANYEKYRQAKEDVEWNRNKKKSYDAGITYIKKKLTSIKSDNVRKKLYAYIDNNLRPIRTDINIFIHIICTKTNEERRATAHYDVLEELVLQEAENALQREFIQKERELLTPKLRYKILRRDGFRCKQCGSTEADGVKLHVDHIIPVSKGGKSIESNLQTLCHRCNMSKSNKYY